MFKLRSKSTISGGEALFAAAFLYATTNVLVREMAHMWGDQAQIAARFILVWLILTIFARFTRTKLKIPRKKMPLVAAYSVLAAIAILFFTLSVQLTTIANTLFLSSATELVAAFLLGTLVLHESLTGRKFLALGLSLAGVALYSGALLAGDAGLVFGLLAGITTGFCNMLAKKLTGVPLNAVVRAQFGVGAVIMIILTLIFSAGDIVRTVSPEGNDYPSFAAVLIIATRLVLYGFQHFDVNIASVILSSQLAMGALLGFLVYSEVPAANELISGVLIVSAAIISSFGQRSTGEKATAAARQ